jgi:hypothetical protein
VRIGAFANRESDLSVATPRAWDDGAERYIRQAIIDYRATSAAEHFDWGDAIGDIPTRHWAKYGLRFLPEPTPAESSTVDHKEQF